MRDSDCSEQPIQSGSRMTKLKRMVCAGEWGADNKICLIRWIANDDDQGGGHWEAWRDPDPIN